MKSSCRLLLNRPQQPARFVEADIVGPTVEGREALLTSAAAAATVTDAAGALCTQSPIRLFNHAIKLIRLHALGAY